MNCSRREFLKISALLTVASYFSPDVFFKKANAFIIDGAKLIKLIKLDCVDCSFDGFCIDCCPPEVAPRIKYWLPHGFIEATKAGEVGASHPALSFFKKFLKPLLDVIPYPKGSQDKGALRSFETYMKVYPHFLGFPGSILEDLLGTLNSLNNPECLCTLTGAENFLGIVSENPFGTVYDNFSKVYEWIDKAKKNVNNSEVISQINQFQKKLDQIQNTFSSLIPETPFFLSEMVFPFWIYDVASFDAYTVKPFYTAIQQAVVNSSSVAGQIACPHLIEYIGSKISLPGGIDPSFVCVGYWGYGYPRIGAVKNDDPVTAGLLAIARFHHLFSRTVPIISIAYDSKNTKYQMYNPEFSDCFKPGYYSVDPTTRALQQSLSTEKLNNVMEAVKNPEILKKKFTPDVKSFNWDSIKKAGNVALQPLNYRDVGVVVWKKHKKCCW